MGFPGPNSNCHDLLKVLGSNHAKLLHSWDSGQGLSKHSDSANQKVLQKKENLIYNNAHKEFAMNISNDIEPLRTPERHRTIQTKTCLIVSGHNALRCKGNNNNHYYRSKNCNKHPLISLKNPSRDACQAQNNPKEEISVAQRTPKKLLQSEQVAQILTMMSSVIYCLISWETLGPKLASDHLHWYLPWWELRRPSQSK